MYNLLDSLIDTSPWRTELKRMELILNNLFLDPLRIPSHILHKYTDLPDIPYQGRLNLDYMIGKMGNLIRAQMFP